MHRYQDLITLFNQCFESKYNTRLMNGDEEPIYLPANENQSYHTIYFAYDYFSSALHECAHWLIAGKERRQQVDFGYWYAPDGRNEEEQKRFQQVEVKPQALEWILSDAANHHFQISIDNLNGIKIDTEPFKEAVYQQVLTYCEQGLSPRAQLLRKSLCQFYGTSSTISSHDFLREKLSW